MIRFRIAPPGTGKTLFSVQCDIPVYLKMGWNIYHNIPGLDAYKLAYYCGLYPSKVENLLHYMYQPYLDRYIKENFLASELNEIGIDKIEEKYYKELSKIYRDSIPKILAFIPSLPRDYFIVLDEAQNFIPATKFREESNVRFFEYATVHRHQGHDLLLLTQHEDNVDVKIRRIANNLIYMYRRDILGFIFRNTVKEKHYAGCATGNPELLNSFVVKYDSIVFGMYKSYAEDGIKEVRRHRSIWFNAKLIALAVVLIVCLFRIPGFLKKWGIIKPVSESKPKFVLPSDYLGDYEDYYCGAKLYVLRPSGNVEFWEPDGVPVSVCPYKNYSPSLNKEKSK